VGRKQGLISAEGPRKPVRTREVDKVTPGRHLYLITDSFTELCVGQPDISRDGE
jgi:hypothetical protein